MARGPSIVVGLDFGTTFSGYAKMNLFHYGTSVKVPSVISYDGQRTYWGYQVRPFTEAFRGVKLLLDESQETKYTPSLALKALLVKHKTNAVQVMADYLQYLVEYAKSVLQRRFGIPAKDMDLQFTLTVPAVWSDTAKDRTMNAAIKANIRPQDVTLVSEPEAAALYTLRSIQGNSSSVRRICGSMLLDQRFEELLRDRMGVNYATLSSKSKEAALSYWQDRVKPNYTGKLDNDYADVDYFIPLPGVADDLTIPIEDGFFQLSSDDVEDIFEPIIHDVEELITEQVASITKRGFVTEAIVLVGGFGSSEYLLRRLQKENPTVTILNNIEYTLITGIQSSTIREDKPIKMDFYRTVRVRDAKESLSTLVNLYICNDTHAPKAKNNRIMKLCDLDSDLSQIPRRLFERKRNSQRVEYFKIPYKLVMTPTSASLLFELEFEGVSYGCVRSKY
ncbi:hypothetical protein BDV24DRAFT_148082 [Aspergillus arachidicola]|uniref:Actin-like ATPase domain-containing protein n=1 Tax=Aspergillus arachidicola TaxID=656916 RepID=A0A5N6YJ49_9EURO|nr:hypothetical protein BDV24DRAFT_148082 [Aspergillus arachidicola]